MSAAPKADQTAAQSPESPAAPGSSPASPRAPPCRPAASRTSSAAPRTPSSAWPTTAPSRCRPRTPSAPPTPSPTSRPPSPAKKASSTKVLTASGTTIPISQLKPGDKILATNTTTGTTTAQTVSAVLARYDTDKYSLRVQTPHGATVIHTTRSHLFFDPSLDKFIPADKLKPGQQLKTPDGQIAVVVGGSVPAIHYGWMWDLTVPGNNDHDFYVVAGATPVLVHNSDCGLTTFYHGSDVNSLVDILNNGLDASNAAASYTDGPGGFFMATKEGDAEFFAVRNGSGAVIKIRMSDSAISQLQDAGAVIREIPMGPKSPTFEGQEFHVPTSAFDLFNQLQGSGEISVSP